MEYTFLNDNAHNARKKVFPSGGMVPSSSTYDKMILTYFVKGVRRFMNESKQKEDLQISYISAICAAAGLSYERTIHDEDSTDGTIKAKVATKNRGSINSELRVQLKCTSSSSQYTDHGTYISYKLKKKNYDDLRAQSTVPIILCLMVLPEDISGCVQWSTEELLIKGCMYWADLSKEAPSDNREKVSVHIDKTNVINQESLQEILRKIGEEEWP